MTMTLASSKYSARDLDQRVTLQRQLANQDGLGNSTGQWVDVADVWARVQPLRGKEFFAAGQMQSSAEVRIVIRWRDDVLPTWRVMWGDTPHEIVAPPANIDGQKHWLEIMCTSGIRNG
jgi:SPP1 family predicted phage head-tail adaptor